ncbi:FAD-binding oxidoreductase [Streptomyces sp. NPDC048270]|uniref:FAD-binding oxidoreductase n=1 Tax=Streptomyces sp. NPDC048270 TaxID=3154615 RepID=UPI003405C75E
MFQPNDSRIDQIPSAPSPAAIAELGALLSGRVVLPGERGYDECKSGFEQSVVHRPALIVAAENTGDLVASVRFAAEHGLGVAVQATGHGACVPADENGLLVNTSGMRRVRVYPKSRIARVEAGACWADVMEAAAEWGLAPLSGAAPGVGAISYLLGGGLGLLSRAYGSACDHVRSFSVITADGHVLEVSPRDYPGLFWGLRGSRGNLGIVASASISLFPLDEFFGGGLFFDGVHSRTVLDAYTQWTATVPDTMGSSVCLIRFPAAPGVPDLLRDRFVVHLRVAFIGSEEQGRALLRPLYSAAQVLHDTTAPLSYWQSGSIHADPTLPAATRSRTMTLRSLEQPALDVVERLAGPEAQAPYMLELRHMGGALARKAAVPGAIGHYPDAAFSLFTLAHMAPDGDSAETGRRQDELITALTPWAAERVLPNFLTGPQSQERLPAAYSPTAYAKLQALKGVYDPGNMFRYNPNILPQDQL